MKEQQITITRELEELQAIEQEIKNGCDCDDGEYYENEDK